MLAELLSKAATIAMLSFVVSSMLAMGAGLTIPQIAEPLRNARLVVLALLANFVLMPLGAIALAKLLWLDESFAIGLLLLGCAAGAPFLPKLAELAKEHNLEMTGAFIKEHLTDLARKAAGMQRNLNKKEKVTIHKTPIKSTGVDSVKNLRNFQGSCRGLLPSGLLHPDGILTNYQLIPRNPFGS